MRTVKTGLLSAMLLVMLTGCAAAPLQRPAVVRGDYGSTRKYIAALIRQEMEAQQVTGLSIALVDDQKVVWAEGFGFADKVKGIAATPDTIYRTGSIAKLFTTTAALQLADDGLLNIDAPLQRYLPEFSVQSRFAGAAPITARTIMTHHSGLPADLLKGMWTSSPQSLAEEAAALRDQYVANPPDYVFAYSNVAMSLLGHALEKIAERDFAAQMSIALFLPLRMTNSTFSSKIDRSDLASKAYRNNVEAAEPPLRDIPAGGLNSSVLDLSRFITMIFGNGWYHERQILKSETLAEMLRPQNSHVPLDLSFRVGLGWMLGTVGGLDIKNAGSVAHQSGATLYHRSQLVILPEQKLGVVLLANSASASSLLNTLATETLKLALEAKSGITQPARQQPDEKQSKAVAKSPESKELPPSQKAVRDEPGSAAIKQRGKPPQPKEERKQLTSEELQAYAGSYDTLAGLVRLKYKSDYLKAELLNRSLRLVPRPDGLLGMSYKFLGLFSVSLGELDSMYIDREMVNGRDILKVVSEGNEYLAGERLKAGPIPEPWRQRQGEYEIINSGEDTVLLTNIRLRSGEDLLIVEYKLPLFTEKTLSVALEPLSATEAVVAGLGGGKGETVKVITRGGEELLAYSGYLLRKKR